MNTILNSVSTAAQQSVLTRALANIAMFTLFVGAVVVAGVEILQRTDINLYILAVVSAGAGYYGHLLGVNFGLGLQPMKIPGANTSSTVTTTNVTTPVPPPV